MVARSSRDADEREVVLDGNGCHQRLRAIATRHGQAIGAAGDRIAGKLLEIETVIEHDHFDAKVLGEFDEPELRHLAAP